MSVVMINIHQSEYIIMSLRPYAIKQELLDLSRYKNIFDNTKKGNHLYERKRLTNRLFLIILKIRK